MLLLVEGLYGEFLHLQRCGVDILAIVEQLTAESLDAVSRIMKKRKVIGLEIDDSPRLEYGFIFFEKSMMVNIQKPL